MTINIYKVEIIQGYSNHLKVTELRGIYKVEIIQGYSN